MLSLSKTNSFSKSLHPAHVPLFAKDINNPTSDSINYLYKKLVQKSNGQNPDFWSRRTPLDYISSIFTAAGALCAAVGFQVKNSTTKNLGIGLFLFSVGSFIYSAFNKITLHPPEKIQNNTPTDETKSENEIKNRTIDSAAAVIVLDIKTVDNLMKTVRNSALDFYERERAYDDLHENLSASKSLPHEYDSFIHELQEFNSHREEEIEKLKPTIERLASNFKLFIGDSDSQKERFAKNFADILLFINNNQHPTTSKSDMLRTTIRLIKEKWKDINSVSTCVQEMFNCLFKWIEESPKYPSNSEEMPVMNLTKAIEKIIDLSKGMMLNLDINSHDYSKYDDFILKLQPLLKSDNLNLQKAARSILEYSSHPLGVKPLIESLRAFNPKNRISISESRNKVELLIKEILKNIGITVGPDPFRKVEVALKKDLFDYLSDSNNDILIAVSNLVNPSDEKVCKKLVSLLDNEDSVLKTTLIDVLSPHIGNPIVKNKLTELLNDEKQNPFIRYSIAEILENTNVDRISLLIASLNSDNADIVNFAASRLEGTDDLRIIEPLVNASKKGSIDAFFTLSTVGVHNTENGFNVDNFIKEELPKLLEEKRYPSNHINREKANRILESLNTPPNEEMVKV